MEGLFLVQLDLPTALLLIINRFRRFLSSLTALVYYPNAHLLSFITRMSHNPVPSEFRCIICADWLSEPHAPGCGHMFCYTCIKGAIIGQNRPRRVGKLSKLSHAKQEETRQNGAGRFYPLVLSVITLRGLPGPPDDHERTIRHRP